MYNKHNQLSKHFNSREFDSPDISYSGNKMDRSLINKLERLRVLYDKPIIVNSGYRSIRHNSIVGGVSGSSHCKGLAVDIKVSDNKMRYEILKYAFIVGFNRIGLGTNFIHLDVSITKSPNVIWLY